MARFATTIVIAGITYSGCKGLLLDGQQFADPVKGSVAWAMDSTPHPQSVNTQFKGLQFGVSLGEGQAANLISKVNSTIIAIRSAMNTNEWFPLLWTDEQYTLSLRCIKDFSQQWYSYGPYSEGYLQSVVFRFIVHEKISAVMTAGGEIL